MKRIKQKTNLQIAFAKTSPVGGFRTVLPELVLPALLTAVCALLFLQMFEIPCSGLLICLFIMACSAGLSLLSQRIGGRTPALYLLLSMAVVCALFYKPLWSGFLVIVNQIFLVANLGDFSFILYETGVPAGQEALYATIALLFAAVLFSGLVVWAIKRRLTAVIFVLTVPFPLLGFYFSLEPTLGLLPALSTLWVILVVYCALAGKDRRVMNLPHNLGRLTVTVSAAAIAGLLVFYGLFSLFLPADEYAASGGVSDMREVIFAALDDFRYEKKNGAVELPRGDLSKESSRMYTDNVALVVSLEKPHSLYLKGFAGGVYRDNRWSNLPAEAYSGDYKGMFAWLSHHDFYPQTQLGKVGAMTMGAQSGWINVRNQALNSKYIYTPYELFPTQDLASDQVRYENDLGIYSRGLWGLRNYTFDMYLPVIADYGAVDLYYWLGPEVLDSPEYHDYLELEKIYRTFVYDAYLDVSEEDKALLQEYFTPEVLAELKDLDYRAVVKDIRQYFTDGFSSDLEMQPLASESFEGEADFVASFLQRTAGSDVHFSTLAALLLRTAGIPARYAEGFYITPADAALYSEMTSITFYLPDSAAHAWVELYVDGVGWLPVEFTPGYFSLVKNETTNEGITQLLKENSSYFYLEDREEPVEETAPEEEPEPPGIWLKLWPFLLALLLLLLYFSVRALYMTRRRKSFGQPDARKGALARYTYLSRLFRFDGTRMDRHAAYAVLSVADGKYDTSGLSLEGFLDVVYTARFSAPERTLDQTEKALLQDYTEAVSRLVYKRQKGVKKLWMRFIWLV